MLDVDVTMSNEEELWDDNVHEEMMLKTTLLDQDEHEILMQKIE